jgi:hypothetical protein
MARYYGSLKGQARTQATRRGSKTSGIECHVRGWEIGCKAEVNEIAGADQVTVYLTSGSNERIQDTLIGQWTLDEKGNIICISKFST